MILKQNVGGENILVVTSSKENLHKCKFMHDNAENQGFYWACNFNPSVVLSWMAF